MPRSRPPRARAECPRTGGRSRRSDAVWAWIRSSARDSSTRSDTAGRRSTSTSPTSSARTALPAAPELDLLVADASVLVELVIAGRHRRGADVLLSRYAASPALTLVSAAHGLIEAMSAVRRLTLRDVLTPEHGLTAVEWLGELDLVLDATAPRLRRIWSLRERMSAYDAAYAAAAEAFDAPLITVDTRLLRACHDAAISAMHLDGLMPVG
jgi:predicted nucleic acid-binding protein